MNKRNEWFDFGMMAVGVLLLSYLMIEFFTEDPEIKKSNGIELQAGDVGSFNPGEFDYNQIDPEYATIFLMMDSSMVAVDSVIMFDDTTYVVQVQKKGRSKITWIMTSEIKNILFIKRGMIDGNR